MSDNANGAVAQALTRRIDAIVVGQRHRRDMGDIAGLAASIRDVGLLHPVVVRPDGVLIAGTRRLAAFRALGRSEIPATVVDLEEIVRGELAENVQRKNLQPSEIDAIRRAIEPLEKAAAKERMSEGGKGRKVSLPSQARDRVGAFAGVSGRQVDKIAAVCAAAAAEPERFGKLAKDMDRAGRVNGAYRRLCNIRQAERIRAEPPPRPSNGPYRVGVVDYPWPYEVRQEDPSLRAMRPYPTMSIEQICATRAWLPALMHDDAILWLWCTNYHLIRYVAPVVDALGFAERSIVTWVKDRFGTGHLLRSQTEHCVVAVRGKPIVTLTNESTVLFAPAPREHSAKPPEFYDLVERLCPAPRYLDIYSRYRHNDKWDCYGAEAPAESLAVEPPILRRAPP